MPEEKKIEKKQVEKNKEVVNENTESVKEDKNKLEDKSQKSEESSESKKENSDKKTKESSEKNVREKAQKEGEVMGWEPKTELGRMVKDGKIKNIDEILDEDKKILESEIVDALIDVNSELVNVGQAKGKFGGGKRRIWRQTQKKTKEGNVPAFSTMAIIGDECGHVGIGQGKARETLPAKDKAIKRAKINIIKIIRACESFDCSCGDPHSVPFQTSGKVGGVKVTLFPAPQGTGLVVANELKKLLKLAGIKDVYSRTEGKKRTTFNLIKACMEALKNTNPLYRK